MRLIGVRAPCACAVRWCLGAWLGRRRLGCARDGAHAHTRKVVIRRTLRDAHGTRAAPRARACQCVIRLSAYAPALAALNSPFRKENDLLSMCIHRQLYHRQKTDLDALIFDKSNLSSSTECFTSSGPMSKILTLFPRSPKLIDYSGVSACLE